MVLNNDQDLPAELLKKLENLQLELEDGDITQKGYDKKRITLLEQHTQQKKEEALLASLGPEPSAADVIDFLDYLPSPTHSPPRPSSGEQFMEQNHQGQQHASSSASAPRVSSVANNTNSNNNQLKYPTTDPYQQRQQQWQQQQSHGQPQQTQQPQVGYPPENTMVSGQHYSSNMVSGSPRPRPFDPRRARPQYALPSQQYYTAQPHTTPVNPRPLSSTPTYQQQLPQQRPIPFPGSSYPQHQHQQQPQHQRPVYPNQPRPMYRPGTSSSMMIGGMQRPPPANGGGAYYRPGPSPPTATPQGYPPSVYPVHGRSPTLDQQRVPYGYNNGGVSRSPSQGRYS